MSRHLYKCSSHSVFHGGFSFCPPRFSFLFPFLFLFLFLLSFAFSTQKLTAQQRKSFIPRTIDWGYKIVQGDSAHPYKKYIFAVPIIAYRPESKWIFGLSMAHIFRTQNNDLLTRPSTIRLNVSYSQLKQSSIRPFFEYFSKGNKICLRAQYQFTDFAEYYWGIGPNVPESNKELYKFRMQKGNFKAAYLVAKGFYAGLQYSFENMYNLHYSPGSNLEVSGLNGSRGYYASALGYTLFMDTRDNVYFPFKGNFIEFSNLFYQPAFGSNYTFSNITLDARKYVQLWKENVLAFQCYLNTNSGNIPFRMQGTIGSDAYMRGYYSGRFRDQNALAFQTEFRKTIWGPVGCVVFVGTGSVNKSVTGLPENLKPNFGAGLRVKAIPRERLNMRMDYGFGSHGISAFYLTLNEAF